MGGHIAGLGDFVADMEKYGTRRSVNEVKKNRNIKGFDHRRSCSKEEKCESRVISKKPPPTPTPTQKGGGKKNTKTQSTHTHQRNPPVDGRGLERGSTIRQRSQGKKQAERNRHRF